jgi:8-oxo-dGTP pyrophosphatase MutT (NUDIX family)
MASIEQKESTLVCAGILPFFDNGKMVLLGKEFRKRNESYSWMEFGGKKENEETLAETACREANEETAQTIGITLEQVLIAEKDGHYIDYHNDKTNTFYRMYCIKIEGEKADIETFNINAKNFKNVGKIEWQYFNSSDVIYNKDGNLPGTEVKLYSTMCARLEKLRSQEFLQYIIS